MHVLPNNNGTAIIHEFILLGFLCSQEVEILLFVLFSIIYILTLLGNSAIICAVWWNQQLHTPMYTLLSNFSFLEICYINSMCPTCSTSYPRPRPSPIMAVSYSSTSSSLFVPQNSSSWPSWHLIGMLPSAIHCIIPP